MKSFNTNDLIFLPLYIPMSRQIVPNKTLHMKYAKHRHSVTTDFY